MHNLVIIGGSFSSLKFITLIKAIKNKKLNITLISNSGNFIFLPLIPNCVEKFIEKRNINNNEIFSKIKTDLKKYSRIKDIKYLNKTVSSIEIDSKTIILEDQKRIKYDFLFLADGNSYINDVPKKKYFCIQNEWDQKLNQLSHQVKLKKDINIFFEKYNLSEFEYSASFIFNKKNHLKNDIKLYTPFNNTRSFNSNPTLKTINDLKPLYKKIESKILNINTKIIIKDYKEKQNIAINFITLENHKKDDLSFLFKNQIYPLGSSLSKYLNIKGNAQFSSFSAKYFAFIIISFLLKDSSEFKPSINFLKSYQERGKMIYTGLNNGLIILNITIKNFIKFKLKFKGYFAGLARYLFYIYQNNIFYMPNKNNFFILNLYQLYLNLWVKKYQLKLFFAKYSSIKK